MPTFLEGAFQLLFKYRPAVFAQGDLVFGVAGPLALGLIVATAVLGAAILTYRRVGARSSGRDRVVLGLLRAAVLVVVVACLFRPMLLLSSPVPQRNFVGVLVDDSRSMQIADDGGRARAEVIRAALGTRDSALVASLRERFQVRLFRFGSALQRIEGAAQLGFNAAETRLGDAIARARQELDAVPLSGLVVLSDGADNAGVAIATELASLRARGIPVFTVGIGEERFDRDVEIDRVELPRQVLEGSAFMASVLIRQRGYERERVPLVVEADGRVIAREEIELPPDGAAAPVRLPVTVEQPGVRTLRFHIPVQSGEQVTQNNERHGLIDVRHRREKVLYVEGEPRYEVRFIREAVEADSNLQLVVLQRTAENKYLRLNVDGPTELAGGFPATRAELFRYRAVVLGSIEASAFTPDQLRMLADFVSVRGGGMLFLGGRRAFGEGGYAGTPLADVLPVYIAGDAVPDSLTPFATLSVRLTAAGAGHPVTQHAAAGRGADRGSVSPIVRVPVTSVNRVTRLKPGAISLLEGSAGRQRQPVLAFQRFGRGLAVAMPIQDSFLWYMDADVPVGDVAHRTLWRRLLRWLTSDTPELLRVSTSVDRVQPGGSVAIRAELADSSFVRRNDARLVARVRAPSGAEREVPLEWVVDRDGEYQGTFSSEEPGVHTVRVTATVGQRRDASVIQDSTHVAVADLGAEFFAAEMRRPLLRRIADETGGRFYTPATMGTLRDDIALSKRGVTVVQQMDLWDMPAVLVLLIVLLAAEWAHRRRRGLA